MGETTFGQVLDNLMKAKGMNAVELEAATEELGHRVTDSTISNWVRSAGDKGPRDPDKVFVVERALGVAGGVLSQHLGWVPAGASDWVAPSAEAAILSDPALSPNHRKSLVEFYRICVAASATQR